jgi:hypothetical protein
MPVDDRALGFVVVLHEVQGRVYRAVAHPSTPQARPRLFLGRVLGPLFDEQEISRSELPASFTAWGVRVLGVLEKESLGPPIVTLHLKLSGWSSGGDQCADFVF